MASSQSGTTHSQNTSGLAEPKTATISNGRKQILSKYMDGMEMIEEYDVVTDELLLRKVRRKPLIGGEGVWVIEVGSDSKKANVDRDLICESNTAPALSRQDTAEAYVFRIRNCPWGKEVYSVAIEPRGENPQVGSIVVRTSNKKYFKVIEVPELNRSKVAMDPSLLTWDHKFDTLIVTYKKPLSMRVVEAQEKKERATMSATRLKEDDGRQCQQQ
eukprot:CAMPEP_0176455148 /NCGR_PEP_ID=MMETSP0127-20121128/30431_1 /TAXON_ID=938130 /ORGANISM="Platyophrya macrostoma, Strain WH" /LENGTH=215 /DNA_ID=CAMNT_0017844683 /DNA_START=10 /DNA_END=657 /DNA_ORIENTATION=+